MYTLLIRSQYYAYYFGLTDIDYLFDQVCYAKACQIICSAPDEFRNVMCRLGHCHTISVIGPAIFKRFGDASLTDIITESRVLAT